MLLFAFKPFLLSPHSTQFFNICLILFVPSVDWTKPPLQITKSTFWIEMPSISLFPDSLKCDLSKSDFPNCSSLENHWCSMMTCSQHIPLRHAANNGWVTREHLEETTAGVQCEVHNVECEEERRETAVSDVWPVSKLQWIRFCNDHPVKPLCGLHQVGGAGDRSIVVWCLGNIQEVFHRTVVMVMVGGRLVTTGMFSHSSDEGGLCSVIGHTFNYRPVIESVTQFKKTYFKRLMTKCWQTVGR